MRIGTFNVENLFTRYLFARGVDRKKASQHGFTSEDLRFRLADPVSKALTGRLMDESDVDVWALQEVDSLITLKRFRDRYLGGRDRYPHALLIDGNDQRGIDVAILSKHPIVHARSWQHLLDDENDVLFDRDCLEVDVAGPNGTVTFYVNHFKSMRAPNGDRRPGRTATAKRREAQASGVRKLIEDRFGDGLATASFVVVGDLNDHAQPTKEGSCGIFPLLHWSAVENVVDRMPEAQRWTHWFAGSRRHDLPAAKRQLDYLLVSRHLADQTNALPEIDRRGLPHRAKAYTGKRLDGIGRNRPKASDHCPVVFDLSAANNDVP